MVRRVVPQPEACPGDGCQPSGQHTAAWTEGNGAEGAEVHMPSVRVTRLPDG
ncbi:MAG: hypothetical protein ACI3XW_08860 [Butyricicoccus sp.]